MKIVIDDLWPIVALVAVIVVGSVLVTWMGNRC